MKRIGDFELVDHGIEHSQYFQGCSRWVGYIEYYSHIVTGIGDNLAEAIDDCLEGIAQQDFDVEGMEERILEEEGWTELPTEPEVEYVDENDECCEEDSELHYHVSIRWNEAEAPNLDGKWDIVVKCRFCRACSP